MAIDREESRIVSRADIVFESLENDILSGAIEPGTILCEQKISDQLGVSRTPVREALNRLKQAELLRDTGKGLCAVGITKEDIEDIYEIRSRIEGLATARCARVITPEQLQVLKELVDMEEFYTAKGMADQIKDVDSRFHEHIYEYCGSSVFHTALSSLHRKILKYRKLSVQNPERALIAMREHGDIYIALAAHDPAAAEKAALAHVLSAKKHVLQAKNKEDE